MAFPVTHILVPMIFVDLYRRYISKKKFSYYWVLLAGFFGLFPDFDIFLSRLVSYSTGTVADYHRGYTHSLFFLALFLIIGIALYIISTRTRKTKRKIRRNLHDAYFAVFIASFAILTHILLDFIDGHTLLLYPLLISAPNINIFGGSEVAWATLDGIILILWLILQENVWEPLIKRLNRILKHN